MPAGTASQSDSCFFHQNCSRPAKGNPAPSPSQRARDCRFRSSYFSVAETSCPGDASGHGRPILSRCGGRRMRLPAFRVPLLTTLPPRYRPLGDDSAPRPSDVKRPSVSDGLCVVATGLEPVLSLRSVRFAIVTRGAVASRAPLLTTLPPRYRPLGDDSAPRPSDVNDVLFA